MNEELEELALRTTLGHYLSNLDELKSWYASSILTDLTLDGRHCEIAEAFEDIDPRVLVEMIEAERDHFLNTIFPAVLAILTKHLTIKLKETFGELQRMGKDDMISGSKKSKSDSYGIEMKDGSEYGGG